VSQGVPEQSIKGVQRRTGSFPFENRYLLPKREDLDSGVGAATQEGSYRRHDGQDEFGHEPSLVTSRNGRWIDPELQSADSTGSHSFGYPQAVNIRSITQSDVSGR
jgi:hypothetical protein